MPRIMMNDEYCVFILMHGRPNRVVTYHTLRKSGYTGKIYLIIDDEDKEADEYKKIYGDQVIQFCKKNIADKIDEGDNFEDRRAIIYARNACFEIAEKLNIKYFIQLDDDYTRFAYRVNYDNDYVDKGVKNLDIIFNAVFSYYKKINALSIALSQSGDYIGGKKSSTSKTSTLKRKCMNSFFCSTERPFQFMGKINEDVNAYTYLGSIGKLFFTIVDVSLTQITTQHNKGGMSDLYLDSGTYIKSFYTVMYCPSFVKIYLMQSTHQRLHHSISWENAVPLIIDEKYKK